MAYNSIRLAAYEPDRAAESFAQQWYGLAFPARWRKLLLDYWKLGKRNPDRRERVPIRHLNEVIRAVAPDLVTVARGATVDDGQPWIYARQPFPIPLLRQMVLAWIRGMHPEPEFLAATTELVEALDFDELCWEPVTVDLLGRQLSGGGTTEPDGRLYQLLPDELARRALELEPYSFEDVHLSFRIAASTRGAELISWPPREYLDDNATWRFSLVVSLTVQTIPFEDYRVHVRTGVRRWCTNGPASIPYRRAVSVYLLTSSPWLQGGPDTARFAVSGLCRSDTGAHEWTRGGPEGMLRQLSFAQHFPEPQDIQASPGGWTDGLSGVTACVVYSTHMGEHGVGAGLMPRDRAPLSDWIARAFEPYLRRVPDHRPSHYPVVPRNLAKKPTGKTPEEKEQSKAQILRQQQRGRREGLARILDGGPLEAEVIWQDPRTRDGLLTQLAEALGLASADRADAESRVWRTDELTIRVSLEQAGALAARLSFPGPQPRRKDLHRAISQRRRQAADHFSGSNRPAAHLALIEIGGPQDFGPFTDPKFALRLGCADSGRLTQFINTPSRKRKTATQSSIAHRALESWLDGFRQLGLSVVPEPSLDDLPAGLHHVALWLVKRRADGPTGRGRMTPVAVRTSPSGAISGWDMEAGEWIPYRHMLLRLTRHAEIPGEEEADTAEDGGNAPVWVPDLGEQRAITAQFIKTLLYSLRGEQMLLMTHAQNSRSRWPALLNGNMRRDTLQFGASAAQGIGLYGDGLRHVRIRDNAMDETPQWYAPAQKDADEAQASDHFGIAGGLWLSPHPGDDHRTFVSTSAKASTAKNAAVEASKISPRENLKGNTVIDTGQNASNPGIIELTVAGCSPAPGITGPGADDPELWAALVHQLRRAPDYRDTLALPLQMHLAKLAEEYVLPHDSSDAGSQISNTEDDRPGLGEPEVSEDQHLPQNKR